MTEEELAEWGLYEMELLLDSHALYRWDKLHLHRGSAWVITGIRPGPSGSCFSDGCS